MILLTASESRELDRLSQERYAIASYTLMTRAGEAVAKRVMECDRESVSAGVLVVAGKGNNGGDGFVAAHALRQRGIATHAILLGAATALKGDAARAHSDLIASGATVEEIANEDDLMRAFESRPGVIIDAIFGTGLNAEVSGLPRRAIETINSSDATTVAVDIASGVNADTGAIMGAAVKASTTVTFGYAKFGHCSYPGAERCGELKIENIGFAPEAIRDIKPRGRFLERTDVAGWLEPRDSQSHKGSSGHVLVIAGSLGKGGAAMLASRAALRTGAGLVTAAIPNCIAAVVASGQAELMTEPIADIDGHFGGRSARERLAAIAEGKNAIVVGPGIGVSDDTKALVEWLISDAVAPDRPILMDADALNALAQLGCDRLKSSRGPVVMTPHPGEMARLLGVSTPSVNADRISAARALSDRTGATVLLKGARSIVTAASGEVFVNSTGNPGMASPGMGDALSGMVGALLGQRIPPLHALAYGVFLHGLAADTVAERYGGIGYITGDVIDELPRSLAAVMSANRL